MAELFQMIFLQIETELATFKLQLITVYSEVNSGDKSKRYRMTLEFYCDMIDVFLLTRWKTLFQQNNT